MIKKIAVLISSFAIALVAIAVPVLAGALVVTQTTDGVTLLNALVPNQSQFSSIGATYTYGDPAQIGTYTGFTSPPVATGDGIVLSTGNAVDVVGPSPDLSNSGLPSTAFYTGGSTASSGGSTPEIDAYANMDCII